MEHKLLLQLGQTYSLMEVVGFRGVTEGEEGDVSQHRHLHRAIPPVQQGDQRAGVLSESVEEIRSDGAGGNCKGKRDAALEKVPNTPHPSSYSRR